MKKFIFLFASLFLITSAAFGVTVSDPTQNFGPTNGFVFQNAIKGPDIHLTDDLKVDGDTQLVGNLDMAGRFLLDGNLRLAANKSFYSTYGSGLIDWSNATGVMKTTTGTFYHYGNVYGPSSKTFTWGSGAGIFGGLLTTNTFQVNSTTNQIGKLTTQGGVYLPAGNLDVGAAGTTKMGGAAYANSLIVNTTSSQIGQITSQGGLYMPAGNLIIGAAGTSRFGGAAYANSLIVNTTSSQIGKITGQGGIYLPTGDLDLGAAGTAKFGASAYANALIVNTTSSQIGKITGQGGLYLPAGNLDLGAAGTAKFGAAAYANSLVVNTTHSALGKITSEGGIYTPTGNVDLGANTALKVGGATATNDLTVNSTKTLAVTTADKLTVGGVIVPQALCISVPISASTGNDTLWISGGSYQILRIQEAHRTASDNSATVTLKVIKCDAGEDPATQGDAVMSDTINLKGTAYTPAAGTLSAESGATLINTSQFLAVRLNNPATNLAGGAVSIMFKRVA